MKMMNTQVFMLSFLIIGSYLLVQTHADLYDTPSLPPPSKVAGKVFPPAQLHCSNPGNACSGKQIQCPKQCPSFKPANPNAKACFIDCNNPKCESSCKKEKPNCSGKGSACGDPRFVGGDGIVFYFHGKANQHFSLVSDSNFQINSRFIGRRPEGRSRDNTWIQSLGLLFSSNSFTFAAKKVANWEDNVDQLVFTYNNQPITISEGHRESWSAPDSPLVVERTADTNSITVTLPGIVEISASVVPITEKDDRIHNYQIPYGEDCFAHLEVQFRFFDLSERVEGVLGQTYRAEFQSPVKIGVAMPIMGGEARYITSSLVSAYCNSCIFSPSSSIMATKNLGLGSTLDCTNTMSNGRGVVCRR